MKSNNLLVLGVLGVVGAVLWSKARAISTLLFLPGGIRQIDMLGSSPTMTVELLVQNTSSSGFVLESLAGNLFSDNVLIGNVSSFTPVQVNSNSQVSIPVQVRLMLIGAAQEIISAFATNNFQKKIELKGYANAGFVRAPIDVMFTVGA